MPTNEERHTIAEEMRQRMAEGYGFTALNIADEIGIHEQDYDDPFLFDENCWNRLADLIEPDKDDIADTSKMVDLDALLRITEEMVKSSERRKIRGFARRIRKACGVNDE
jgi:hypothetical protein